MVVFTTERYRERPLVIRGPGAGAEVTAAGDAIRDTQDTIDRLTRYIDDLMYESRIRKELTADTALAIMGSQFQADSQAMRVPDGQRTDPAPLESGRVRTTTP